LKKETTFSHSFIGFRISATSYCFYSSWGRGYDVGYATASDIHGPWTKSPQNPIYGAQDAAMCARFHKPYTQSPDVPFNAAGHGEPFIGPDGTWWISVHFVLKKPPPEAAGYHGWAQPGYDKLNPERPLHADHAQLDAAKRAARGFISAR
jgi:hypothetical protein